MKPSWKSGKISKVQKWKNGKRGKGKGATRKGFPHK